MSSNSLGDPRSGRDRRVPTRKHAFERGTLDPISTVKKPMFTIGNGILLVAIVAYGMYATGRLPQLDAFFDKADQYGKAHNNAVVNGLLTYGTYLFFAIIALLVGLIIFSLVNGHRRRVTDRIADEVADRIADEVADRRKGDRRSFPREAKPREDLPSMIVPLGKVQPTRRSNDTKPQEVPMAAETIAAPAAAIAAPVTPAVVATEPSPMATIEATKTPATSISTPVAPVPSIFDGPTFNSAKAAAMAAAAAAEQAANNMPQDMPSFVPMPGKERIRPAKPETRVMGTVKEAEAKVEAPTAAIVTPSVPIAVPAASASAATPADVVAEAAIAAAKVAALKAEAAIAAAKAEAAVADAKLQAAIADAAVAAAKAAAINN